MSDRNPLAVDFGERIRAHRLRAGMSQERLGFRASLHRTEIGLLERGLREPKLDTVVKLAGALSITLDALLEGIDRKPTDSEPGLLRSRGQCNGPVG